MFGIFMTYIFADFFTHCLSLRLFYGISDEMFLVNFSPPFIIKNLVIKTAF